MREFDQQGPPYGERALRNPEQFPNRAEQYPLPPQRELILISRPSERLAGATRIEPGYPKDHTPTEMRGWARDLDQLYATPSADLIRWKASPPEQLTPEQRRLVTAERKFFGDHRDGIQGHLRNDGVVELDTGRHRSGYLLEQRVDPVPVWVSAPSREQLRELEDRCNAELSHRQKTQEVPTPLTARRPTDDPIRYEPITLWSREPISPARAELEPRTREADPLERDGRPDRQR